MQNPTARAWIDGALYFLMFVVGSLVAMIDELPMVKPYRSELAIVGILLTGIKAFMNRSIAELAMKALPRREPDPHDLVERMPGVAETMERALGDVPVTRSAPLPAGPTQLAHLEQVADDMAAIPRQRNFSQPDATGMPAHAPTANPFSQRDADGRFLVDDASELARAQAREAQRQEQMRMAAEQAERDRLAREQAEQEQRRQAEIADLEAKLASLRGGQ